MKMNIMISINRAFIRYACIMLMSLKEHHKGILLSVYILHNDLNEEDFVQMDEIIGSEGIELIPVYIPEGTAKDFQIGDWPEVNAYRLLATDLFADSVERILHLDVDILITGDISEFYNMPFDDNYFIACEDYLSEEAKQQKRRETGRDDNAVFFNAGVLLFNVQKLASEGFYYGVYVDILKKYPNLKIEYPDQDMLNLLFCEKTKYIDRIRYNYSPFYYKMNDKEHYYDSPEQLQENCSIVHMISGTKSWINSSKLAVDELWWKYAKQTPFYLEMKIEHVQAMLRKEQRLKQLTEARLTQTAQKINAEESVLAFEEALYQVLEHEFEIAETIGKLM